MRAKSMIIGFVLLFVGSIVFLWDITEIQRVQEEIARCQSKYSTETDDYMKQYNEWLLLPPDERPAFPLIVDKYGKTKTRAQLRQEQQERLTADLEKLASGQTNVNPFADVLYGENWAVELQAYKKQKVLNKNVLTGSIVCTSMGGLIYAWWLLFGIVQMVRKGVAGLKQRLASSKEEPPEMVDEEMDVDNPEEVSPEDQQPNPQSDPREKNQKVLPKSNWGKWKPAQPDPEIESEVTQIEKISHEAERIALLLSDEKAAQAKALKVKPLAAGDQSKPIDDTLNQLSQEVSAIREYTSYQQDRLEKLQDGYDWNIIRTFCLRVIRCIDNLDNRIGQLNGKSAKATHLTEVRDELIFALESSGVEQFEPEINSDYRGQEKVAEAVKDRQPNEESEQKGKIACVIRPGYQYFISEENIKVVRPAQVRLFA